MRMKLTTCSGSPANRLPELGVLGGRRRTGQVFRWHTRIMMQPSATNGAVAEAKFFAPEEGGDHDIAAVFNGIGFDDDAGPQSREHERLMGSARQVPQGMPACLIGQR